MRDNAWPQTSKRIGSFRVHLRSFAVKLFAFATATASLGAQPAQERAWAERFQTKLEEIAREADGVLGIHAIDLVSGRAFGVRDTLVFPQGSAIKIAILLELYRRAEVGDLKLTDRLPVRASDRTGGSSMLVDFTDGGSELALRDLAMFMIRISDNTATNMLIDRLGMERVNLTMRELGFSEIKLQRKMIRPQESVKGNENIATPRAAARLVARIHKCDIPIAKPACEDMRALLAIPKAGSLPDPLPANLRIEWKPGGITGVETFWGVVAVPGRPYAIAAMLNYGGDSTARDLKRVSAAAYQYFSRLSGVTPYGTRVPPQP
jgi:beta-lactamase class A